MLVSERPQGSFSRQLFLGESLDADRIEANYDHGVLSVSIPVAEQACLQRLPDDRDEGGFHDGTSRSARRRL